MRRPPPIAQPASLSRRRFNNRSPRTSDTPPRYMRYNIYRDRNKWLGLLPSGKSYNILDARNSLWQYFDRVRPEGFRAARNDRPKFLITLIFSARAWLGIFLSQTTKGSILILVNKCFETELTLFRIVILENREVEWTQLYRYLQWSFAIFS